MNYHKILKYDTANGPGIRTTIWFTGCCFRCPACFNAEIQDFNAGKLFDDNAKGELMSYLADPHVVGLSVLGGEPLVQSDELLFLLQEIKEKFPDKTIWMWTGFQLKDIAYDKHSYNKLLKIAYVDYLVDGPYIKDKTEYHTRFRGSSNQIIWHLKKEKTPNEIIITAENESDAFDKHIEHTQNITTDNFTFSIII